MDMQEFVTKLHDRNFGVASFNTYTQEGMNHCFIMIAEKGDKGTFFKGECPYYNLNNMLKSLLRNVDMHVEANKNKIQK